MRWMQLGVFLFFVIQTVAQEDVVLQMVPIQWGTPQTFHIKEVIDKRQEKYLGRFKDVMYQKRSFRLAPDAAKAIRDFLVVSLPDIPNTKKISIVIEKLAVQQAQISPSVLKARVLIQLSFLEERDDKGLKEVYNLRHYEEEIFPLGKEEEAIKTQEKRIRAALEYCIRQFTSHKNGEKTAIFSNVAVMSRLGRWYDLFTYTRRYSKYYQGWEVSYIGFSDNDKEFMIPFVMSYGQSKPINNIKERKGYVDVDTYVFSPGFHGYVKMFPGIYGVLGAQFPIGIELLKRKESRRKGSFLMGVRTQQGVKLIPWKDMGLVIGIGAFQRVQTSKVYTFDYGIAFELGIHF